MLKGIQKRIIVIKTQKDSCFESAFFVIRSDKSTETDENAMISEAQRIIAESEKEKRKGGKRKNRSHTAAAVVLALACGIIFGAAAVWILLLILG